MAVSTYVKTGMMSTIVLTDGTPTTPLTITLDTDNGDFSLTGLEDGLREMVKHERKGQLVSVSYGNRVYPSGSFSAKVAQFSDGTSGTLSDFILRTSGSAYSAAKSTQGTGKPYTIDLQFTVEGTNYNDAVDHTFTLEDCRVKLDFSEGDSDSFAISFEVLGAITGDLAQAIAA